MAIQRRPVDKVGSGARYVVLVLGAVLFLVPFYLLLRNGLSTEADITSPDWTLFPSSLQWGNIAELLASDRAIGTDRLSNSSATLPHWRLLGNRVQSGEVMSASVERPFRSNR